ncbi:outer membrane receptor protein involved in Fe transport [Herbaspirillum sp. Sphag1AN]|uniref:TonB-dependent receptor n=1 Tax=unclassified Herbaspirillum TaxID=2624150 RepID=UPI001622BB5C|nr:MULTISPECIES: TonB-dependent receptor [unclassified Herbaspirillum]MBB3211505.1 outer membrane receptor protein involved in Fe transport [Herbaspirillum sp. Sphag1AN]MBB3245229.1 outer membrane receptor protein involved in Fe transport [Herbaspirillum sp. Sphag64]
MNTRLLKLSALVALAYTTSTSASQAESLSQPITPTIAEQQGQTQNDTPKSDGTSTEALPVIEVSSDRLNGVRNSIQVETGSSTYHISHKDIESLPLGEDSSFNQVLLQAPGVAQDSYGQLHVRGDHANLQYRLNGILLPESISGFGQTLDTHFIDSVNLITGALPAQYGYRTAGIVDIQTKTGQLTPEGNIGIVVGSNNTRQLNIDTSGTVNGINYYLSGSLNANNLGIENPTSSSSPLHDRTVQNKGFGYFSYLINPDTRISLILANTNSRFQIPNTAGETPSYPLPGVNIASANLHETQRETNRYEIISLQGAVGDDIDYQIALFSRYTSVSYQPDNYGDLIYTGVTSQVSRSGLANGLQLDTGYRLNDNHTLRAGLSTTREKLSNSDQSLTLPADADGNPTSTTPISISDSASKVTTQSGIYLQDEWKLTDKLTLNYGARFDQINAYVTGSQLSPRIGMVFQMTPDTTLHAGYARYFTPPANELIPASTVASFEGTTGAAASSQNGAVQPERSNTYDIGVSHKVSETLTLGADAYYKQVTNLLDEGQFGSALLYTPFNYAQGKIYGLELTLNYRQDDLSAYFNLARSTALGKNIISSQYNFTQAELNYIANNWVHLDHDQKLTASAGVSYLYRGTTYSGDAIAGSGLRSGFANSEHLPFYTTFNLAASRTFDDSPIGKVTLRLSVVNLLDATYEIRDGSGIGVGAPQYGQRRGFYLAMSKHF